MGLYANPHRTSRQPSQTLIYKHQPGSMICPADACLAGVSKINQLPPTSQSLSLPPLTIVTFGRIA